MIMYINNYFIKKRIDVIFHESVIPAEAKRRAGIHVTLLSKLVDAFTLFIYYMHLDSRFRGNDIDIILI